MSELTPEQRRAVETLDRGVALTAAAGSGKTTVLVERYCSLLRRGIAPDHILTITFTNEAADQIRERVIQKLESENASETLKQAVERTGYLGTIHSFCYRVIDLYGSHLNLRRIRGIINAFQFHALFDRKFDAWLPTLEKADLKFLYQLWGHHDLKTSLQELHGKRFLWKETLPLATGPEEVPLRRLESLVAPLFAGLEEETTGLGEYSFDDLEHFALEILEKSEPARLAFQKQFERILIDEFQDTSANQWKLIEFLTAGKTDKLFVVGDPKQSIYSFRNADVRVFLEGTKQLVAAGGEALELSCNFRTVRPLLDSINQAADFLFHTGEVPFSPMQASRESSHPDSPDLQVLSYAGDKKQWVEAEIASVTESVVEKLSQGAQPQEIALLFRVSDRIPMFAESLEAKGIEVDAQTSSRLFDQYEMLDLFHYLKMRQTPTNDFYLSAFLRSTYVNLSYHEVSALILRPGATLLEKLSLDWPTKCLWLKAALDKKETALLPLFAELFREARTFPTRTASFLALLQPLFQWNYSLDEAVALMESWKKADLWLPEPNESVSSNAVRLLTVHASKGLEFPHVYLVDTMRMSPKRYPSLRLKAGKPPGLRYRESGEWKQSEIYETLSEEASHLEQEESRRILYVALTRARDSLTVFLPADRALIPKNTWGLWLSECLRKVTTTGREN